MAKKQSPSDPDVSRQDIVEQGLRNKHAAAAVEVFKSVSTLFSPPVMVSTAPVRFDASTNT